LRVFRLLRASRRSLTLASATLALVAGIPLAAFADWSQFQGGPSHQGTSDGPSVPLEEVWSNDEIELEDADVTGLSSPVVADDGTIAVVGPKEILGFDGADGSELFAAQRDLGPTVQPAIGEGADGPIVVFTEGFAEDQPAETSSPSVSPSPGDSPGDSEDSGIDSHVRAVDLRTGEPVWDTPVQLEDVVRTPVAADDSTAYVGDAGGSVTAIELSSGEVRWTAEAGTPVAGAVAPEGDRAYVATLGEQQAPGVVVALDTSTGDEVWRSDEDAVLGNLVSSPVTADGRIFVLEPGFVVALGATDGRLLWRTEIVNPQTTPFSPQGIASLAPASADGQVFVVDVSGRVYALDAETGAELWDHALNDPSQLTPPVLTDEHVLVPTNSGALYAVDRRSGHLAFRIDSGGSFLRGLADAGDLLIGVAGIEDVRIVAFGDDPDGSLTDVPSPTTIDVGKMLAGFVLGALPVGFAVLALTRPLQRRLAPAAAPDDSPDEDVG
jgi:outer membrane protein assembly factor BamB